MFIRTIMSYFPGRRKSQQIQPISTLESLLDAARKKNFQQFDKAKKRYAHPTKRQNLVDTPLHLILQNTRFEITSRKKRKNVWDIFNAILESKEMKSSWLNAQNALGQTALHLAIIANYRGIVTKLLEHDADFTRTDNQGRTPLALAAELGRDEIYNSLLQQHRIKNEQALDNHSKGSGYTTAQIASSLRLHQNKLKRRNNLIGGLGAIMVIACPIASILAFDDIPLIGGMLASLIPGVGPFIALGAAALLAGLMCWTVYKKSSLKYGSHGQELAEIEAKHAQLDRLEADINYIRGQYKILNNQKKLSPELTSKKKTLFEDLQRKKQELQDVCRSILTVPLEQKALDADWARPPDVFKARLITGGSFLCSFTGVLGICSGLSAFVPAATFAGIMLAGIPVAGWIALGIAAVAAVSVALWAHYVKYHNTLESYGQSRKELHSAKYNLSQRKCELTNNLSYIPASSPRRSLSQNSDSEDSSPKQSQRHIERPSQASRSKTPSRGHHSSSAFFGSRPSSTVDSHDFDMDGVQHGYN